MPPSTRRPAPGRTGAPRSRYQAPRRSSAARWAIPAVLAVLVLAVVLAIIRNHSGGGSSTAPQPVPQDVLTAVTQVPQSAWDAVGAANTKVPIGIPANQRPASPPTVLYMGAEYCPYCAAMRWSLVTALSRFGTFSGLQLTASSATDIYPSTPTFTLAKAGYQSSNVTLQSVEMQGNTADATGNYPALQKPTSSQEALLSKYDAPPYVSADAQDTIPFVLIGGRYLINGAPFSPGLLTGQTWSNIAASLGAGQSTAAKAILASGNEITAAICAVDGGQATDVCNSPGVKAAAALLPAAGAA